MSSSNNNSVDIQVEMITVKVGKLPGDITLKKIPSGSTAADAFRIAQLDPTDHEVRVNGVPANLTQALRQNDAVLLFKPLAGN